MASNNEILDNINAFFSLNGDVKPINIAPTATGGTGINNIAEFPPPIQQTPVWKSAGTEYARKYLEKEKLQASRDRLNTITSLSALSINTLDDIDDTSTIVDLPPSVDELDSETTRQIYSTYFDVPDRSYDSSLTISNYRDEILQQLNISPVVIIQGPTGCGKTTQVPQYILDYHQSRGTYCNIIVTQPRKIAAMSIARRVCHERNWQLGTIVGYQVAMDRKISSDTRLAYVTTGVLLEKLVGSKRMDMFTHVIIDEVHERNQDIDFALLLAKKFLKTNSQRVKVILMSATFKSTEFAKYFSFSVRNEPAPIIEITGKSKEVTEHYLHELQTLLPNSVPEFDMSCPMIDPCLYSCVLKLMCVFDRIEKDEQHAPRESEYAPKRGAVLIFLPGYEEIASLSNELQRASFKKKFWIIPLHSSITVEEQVKVFRDAASDQRKVIISTNIAESSITVPDIKYVIDFCLTKSLVTDPVTNYTCLQLEWASKANCIQRKGRAGRVDIGRVYRMVPREFYSRLSDYSIPEIKRCPLTNTILHVKKLNICEPQEMLAFALDPPDLADIGNAILQLKEGLALTHKDYNPFDGDLTFIGRVMANLPLDIKFSKLIIFGYVFHCLEECIIIAASLSLQSFFSRPFQKALDAYKSRLSWAHDSYSDCLSYLDAFTSWKRLTNQAFFKRPGGLSESAWAMLNFIQLKRIKEVDMLVKEIKNRLEHFQIYVDPHSHRRDEENNVVILKMIIAGAFFPHYYVQEDLDEVTVNKELNENDPLSTVLVTGLPPKHGILYASALRDLMSPCSNNIMIEFEGSKAYIRFLKNYDKDASLVHPEVYFACKMRKLRMNMNLHLFSIEEADRKTQQIMASKHSEQRGGKLHSNRVTVTYGEGDSFKKDPGLSLKENYLNIIVTQVYSCGNFWARLLREDTASLLRFLETTINAGNVKNLKPLPHPRQHMLCLAPFQEKNTCLAYYRAQIHEIQNDKALVFFIDYGNSEKVNISDLRQIDEATPDVLTTPALAFPCQLSEIKPSSFKSSSGGWCEEANQWFKRQVNGIMLVAQVYSVVQGIARVELRKQDRDGSVISINKLLRNFDYAEKADESFISKQNHELRVNASSVNSSFSDLKYDCMSRDVEVSWAEAETNIQRTGRVVCLRGPSSPLEVSYVGLTKLDRCKQIKVERDSVNSVSFNPEPQESYPRMLVAAHVSVGQDSQDLIARSTTLMPKNRGLPSLICLLFSPYVEIRVDKPKKSYTGALCGLGFDPETGESIYPDHDIEMPFDIEMTLEDIRQVNAIRMGFNLLLHSEDDSLQYETNAVKLIHEQTRKTLLNLMRTNREPRTPEFCGRSGQWNQVDPEQLMAATVESRADCDYVLPLLKPPCLAQMIDQNRAMKRHLDELEALTEHPTRHTKIIRCRLCSVDVQCTRDLLVHLDSRKHREREARVLGKVEERR